MLSVTTPNYVYHTWMSCLVFVFYFLFSTFLITKNVSENTPIHLISLCFVIHVLRTQTVKQDKIQTHLHRRVDSVFLLLFTLQ